MPTMPVFKPAYPGKEAPGGQPRPALPRMRLPVQPTRIVTIGAGHPGHGSWPRRQSLAWKSLADPTGDAQSAHPGPPVVLDLTTPPPLAFARDVLGVELWDKQEEVLTALAQHRRVAVKAGNGLGKGFCAAVALLWFMHTHPDAAIALSTAPTFRQVRHILWRQIRRLYRPAARLLGGTMLDTRWELSDDRYAMGLSADGADQFQGFHSPNLFIVVDEAEGVSEEIYEAIEAVMTSSDPLLLLIGNPTSMSGGFRRAFFEERSIYRNITISALDSPNLRAGSVVMPGLATPEWVEERKLIWGEGTNLYKSRVLGEFPDQGDDTLLSLSDLEAAVKPVVDAVSWRVGGETVFAADRPNAEEVILAVDVARFGTDRTVILRRRGNCVENIHVLRQQDTMEIAGRIVAAIREHRPAEVVVDEIGIGAGVVDRLRELGHRVRGVNVAESARDDRHFANLRAEGYWQLRDRFVSRRIIIPADRALIGELATLRYRFESSGRVRIEAKDEMRKRGLPSPDLADALMLAFLPRAGGLGFWT